MKWDRHMVCGLVICCIFLISGCALTKEYVDIGYDPQPNVEKLTGAESVKTNLKVSDARTIRDKVSCKKNAYGMEMAPILCNQDITKIVQDAVAQELRNRGFIVNGGNTVVGVEVTKFYNDFKTGFFSGNAVGEVMMNVQVKKPDGNINFSKSFTGTYTETGDQLASGKNTKAALDGALKDAVTKLVNDSSFLTALLQANK